MVYGASEPKVGCVSSDEQALVFKRRDASNGLEKEARLGLRGRVGKGKGGGQTSLAYFDIKTQS